MPPLTRARAAAEAPKLLDMLACAPAAAALDEGGRKALRLAHTHLCDAVVEATTALRAGVLRRAAARRRAGPAAAHAVRWPTPARWPRLKEPDIRCHDLAALETLGFGV
jgi:hypothetical protein